MFLQKEEERRSELDIPPEDLALATLPGAEFDPRARQFDMDELRPQPIIRKRPKILVAEERKDERYWEKRNKVKTEEIHRLPVITHGWN